jgi:predicted Fe-S protein YdhL (DUF1289 family)
VTPRKIPSPCTNLCIMDGPTGLCIGCGRTLEEIALWAMLSDRQRQAIVAVLDERLALSGLDHDPRRLKPETG